MRRLTKIELGGYRKRWQRLNPVCPLCKRTMGEDVVVDHNHKTGECRAVICRWCNVILGKLENWAGRRGEGIEPLAFLQASAAYLSDDGPRLGVVYPTHKTEDEKRLARNKKARLTRAKAKKAATQED